VASKIKNEVLAEAKIIYIPSSGSAELETMKAKTNPPIFKKNREEIPEIGEDKNLLQLRMKLL